MLDLSPISSAQDGTGILIAAWAFCKAVETYRCRHGHEWQAENGPPGPAACPQCGVAPPFTIVKRFTAVLSFAGRLKARAERLLGPEHMWVLAPLLAVGIAPFFGLWAHVGLWAGALGLVAGPGLRVPHARYTTCAHRNR